MLHPVLHHGELDRNRPRHLNRAAERDLAVALREVQVTNRELRAFDVHRQVDFRAAGEVLDIAVPTVLRSPWYSTGSLFPDLLLDIVSCAAGVDVLRLRRECDFPAHVAALLDQLAFAVVPGLEDFVGRRAAQDTRVDEPGEPDAGDVAGGAVDAFEVPDGFGSTLTTNKSVTTVLLPLTLVRRG